MPNILHFSASTSVKTLFGQGLVTDQIAAVFELVKNSYDADAEEVHLIFQDVLSDHASITVLDNGSGMDIEDIEKRWMVIGTTSKKGVMYSPVYHRPINGDKGIGRFSVDRLGARLHLEAQKTKSTDRFIIDFDWTKFDDADQNIDDIDIPYTKVKSSTGNHGLKLRIDDLRDSWDEIKLRELYRNLRQFKSPFAQEDNFKIFITASEFGYNKREVTVEKLEDISSLWISAEIAPENPDVINTTVNRDGMQFERRLSNPYSFGAITAQVFMFNQGDKIRFSNRYSLRVREYGNIRLYRDNFRIYPYGEANNDWLDIDRRQTQGMMRFFGTRDLIGYVQISKEYNPQLKPLTNRQGLEENQAFDELRSFVIEICVKTLESFYFQRIKKGTNETVKKASSEIGSAVKGLDKLAVEIRDANPEAAAQIQKFTSTISKQQKSQIQYVQDQQEIVKVYSRIAQKETFLHKLIHQSMIHVQNANIAMGTFLGQGELDENMRTQLVSIKGLIQESLDLLRTVRDDVVKKRVKTDQNIDVLVRKYLKDYNSEFIENEISVAIISKGDLSFRVDPGDIKAILSNLTTNAIKSLKKINDRERTISFEIYRTTKYIVIKCDDNGVGIKEDERERIFDPFHSTTEGFGLGLTIIDEIAKEYSGSFELVDTPVGASFVVKLGV